MKKNLQALAILLLLPLAPALLADEEVIFDEISLSAFAEQEVDNDQVQAVLFVEREGSDPGDLANIVNREMSWALRQLEGVAGMDVSTPAYQTFPIYHQGRINGWRVRQTLRLESNDFVALSEVLGRLQKRLGLQGMTFRLSEEARQAAEDRLIPVALKRYKERVAMVVGELGRRGYRIVSVEVDTGDVVHFRPKVAMMRAEAQVAPPQLESGRSKVRVTVRGSIQLRD